jgi:hypothetical protein
VEEVNPPSSTCLNPAIAPSSDRPTWETGIRTAAFYGVWIVLSAQRIWKLKSRIIGGSADSASS